MYMDFRVEIPKVKGKVYRNKIKGTVYVTYEFGTVYHPDRKYNVPQRTTIGKVCEDDPEMMYPNPSFVKYFPEIDLPKEKEVSQRSCCIRIGSHIVLEKIIRDYRLDEMLGRIIGKDSDLFLDLASYSIVCENNAGQYYPDYAYNHALFATGMRIYRDSKVSDFLQEMTRDQSVGFLNEWNINRDHREKIYISYDSTNKKCQAGDIELVEVGYSKDKEKVPVVNYSIAYDTKNREPLFYEEYPGGIVDISQLQQMLEKARAYGYRNVGFILDRGYFSQSNIRHMDSLGYSFVIMVKGMKDLVSSLVMDQKGSFEDARACHIAEYDVNGKTVKGRLYASDTDDRYFHIFYNSAKHSSERKDLEGKIDRMKTLLKKLQGRYGKIDGSYEKYFNLIYANEGTDKQQFLLAQEKEEVVEREIKLCGYFCIVTSEKMSAKDALMLYKSRDASEKLFRGDKSYLGSKSFRVTTDERLESKIFIEFVALIIRNKFYTYLKDLMVKESRRDNYLTVPAAIKELDKIEMLRGSDGVYRLDHSLTAVQKTILNACGIDHIRVKNAINKITDRLRAGE